MPTPGGVYVWDFERRGRKANIRVDGPLIFNTTPPQVDAALARLGIALLPEDELMPHSETGSWSGCYRTGAPNSRAITCAIRVERQPSPAFSLVLQALTRRN